MSWVHTIFIGVALGVVYVLGEISGRANAHRKCEQSGHGRLEDMREACRMAWGSGVTQAMNALLPTLAKHGELNTALRVIANLEQPDPPGSPLSPN